MSNDRDSDATQARIEERRQKKQVRMVIGLIVVAVIAYILIAGSMR